MIFIKTKEDVIKTRKAVFGMADMYCAVYGAQRSPFRFRTAAFRSKTAARF